MKTAAFIALAAAEMVAGHATFQFIAKNGGAQTETGVRGTSDQNNPILSTATNLASDMMICKGGAAVSGNFEVAGGDKLTLQWHHNKGVDATGDKDEPIAPSHKGPILVYITPAETKGESGWVKIYEEGLTGSQWAVDKFYANGGKIEVTMPNLKAGDYLIRPEIIALHEGNRAGGAQFYNGCGQLKVTGSGSVALPAGVDIRTVYKTDDAGVLFDIYAGKTSYTIPGPKVFAAGSSGGDSPAPAPAPSSAPAPSAPAPSAPASSAAPAPAPTSDAAPAPAPTAPAEGTTTAEVPVPTTMVTSAKPNPAPTAPATGGAIKKYERCGGQGFTTSSACEDGTTCKEWNPWYSQCV